MTERVIIGAGLAGLLAACKWADCPIYESRERTTEGDHKALLRFKSDAVSRLTGIPFKQVTVRKQILEEGLTYNECSIAAANQYSRKVTGQVGSDRSIWNLGTETRWIAPPDFQEQLLARFDSRIRWGKKDAYKDVLPNDPMQIISTAPMSVNIAACNVDNSKLSFDFARHAIRVQRAKLRNVDTHQTVYFPSSDTNIYRASITGDLIIIESMVSSIDLEPEHYEVNQVLKAFGVSRDDVIDWLPETRQQFGKIVDMPKADRDAVMYKLTREYNVFSLGRFATWRNIQLDDVVKDIEVIDRLMQASEYDRHHIINRRAP